MNSARSYIPLFSIIFLLFSFPMLQGMVPEFSNQVDYIEPSQEPFPSLEIDFCKLFDDQNSILLLEEFANQYSEHEHNKANLEDQTVGLADNIIGGASPVEQNQSSTEKQKRKRGTFQCCVDTCLKFFVTQKNLDNHLERHKLKAQQTLEAIDNSPKSSLEATIVQIGSNVQQLQKMVAGLLAAQESAKKKKKSKEKPKAKKRKKQTNSEKKYQCIKCKRVYSAFKEMKDCCVVYQCNLCKQEFSKACDFMNHKH